MKENNKNKSLFKTINSSWLPNNNNNLCESQHSGSEVVLKEFKRIKSP